MAAQYVGAAGQACFSCYRRTGEAGCTKGISIGPHYLLHSQFFPEHSGAFKVHGEAAGRFGLCVCVTAGG